MMYVDVAIIGGGPAGMAAALAAKKQGAEVLILERDNRLGGILNQCIHTGFGLQYFKEELTGPEYASRFREQIEQADIPYWDCTMVTELTDSLTLTVQNRNGVRKITAGAVVLATGCRERPRGALNIPGTRAAGIYSAGTAQKFINYYGYMPGKEIVIIGSGDIGLIMARRMTLEGAAVKLVCEIQPKPSGLPRNIAQCLEDFGIPLKLSHTVTEILGKERVSGVTVSQVDSAFLPISGTEEVISCDTVLFSVGLIPENELAQTAGAELNPHTGGPVTDKFYMTTVPGIFSCGNSLKVFDLVDNVTRQALQAGENAAVYAAGKQVRI